MATGYVCDPETLAHAHACMKLHTVSLNSACYADIIERTETFL